MTEREESLYEVRLCLFGIPLWKVRMGELKNRETKAQIENIDFEAYVTGLEHAKKSRLMPNKLLKSS
ncbi:hypothetical protein [Streptococcus anginosus]|uniref:hypothetical protein n=1 Tax=Streptococcus anginosus TaxID=1328 RepID=UPI001106DAAB|nr:hypothetical protein [Streptococcus anginosus]MED5945232.1 hypothetical protein [Streptococcus anginosus]MED5959199.1 hypothetical protein [Streptococcus anginosus]